MIIHSDLNGFFPRELLKKQSVVQELLSDFVKTGIVRKISDRLEYDEEEVKF
jgi:hypothetical protein